MTFSSRAPRSASAPSADASSPSRSTSGGTSNVSDCEPSGWASYPWSEGGTALKLTFALSGLADVVTAARESGVDLRGSAGTGVVYAAVPHPDGAEAAVTRLREVCTRHRGSLVVVDAPPAAQLLRLLALPDSYADLVRRALPAERAVVRSLRRTRSPQRSPTSAEPGCRTSGW